MAKTPSKIGNVFVLMHKGETITVQTVLKYESRSLYGPFPKKIYYTLGDARKAVCHLPEKMKPHVQIYEFKKWKEVPLHG